MGFVPVFASFSNNGEHNEKHRPDDESRQIRNCSLKDIPSCEIVVR